MEALCEDLFPTPSGGRLPRIRHHHQHQSHCQSNFHWHNWPTSPLSTSLTPLPSTFSWGSFLMMKIIDHMKKFSTLTITIFSLSLLYLNYSIIKLHQLSFNQSNYDLVSIQNIRSYFSYVWFMILCLPDIVISFMGQKMGCPIFGQIWKQVMPV